MPAEPSEMKWNDSVRIAVVSCTTFVAAFAPMLQVYPHLEGLYFASKGIKPLDSISIIANMSLAICMLAFASGFVAVLLVGVIVIERGLKVMFTVILISIGVMFMFDHVWTSTIAGICSISYAILSWFRPLRSYVSDHGKQSIIAVSLTIAFGILMFYKYLGIGAMAAYPLSSFGPNRLQFTVMGTEGYLFLFFWVSLKIFKKDLLGRLEGDPIIYVSLERQGLIGMLLPLLGIFLFFLFAVVFPMLLDKLGFSDKVSLITFLIGHAFLWTGVLLWLFANKIVRPRPPAEPSVIAVMVDP